MWLLLKVDLYPDPKVIINWLLKFVDFVFELPSARFICAQFSVKNLEREFKAPNCIASSRNLAKPCNRSIGFCVKFWRDEYVVRSGSWIAWSVCALCYIFFFRLNLCYFSVRKENLYYHDPLMQDSTITYVRWWTQIYFIYRKLGRKKHGSSIWVGTNKVVESSQT